MIMKLVVTVWHFVQSIKPSKQIFRFYTVVIKTSMNLKKANKIDELDLFYEIELVMVKISMNIQLPERY